MADTIEGGLIPARIFNDAELHEMELDKIFTKAWLFIGHESEIPNRGDFAQRYIGNDSFLFVRGADDRMRVLLNSCRHRGTEVCRAERGNTAQFSCPYHSWTYKNTGELVGVPGSTEAYRGLNKSEWGLLEAPRVDTIHGLVFASLDPNAPSLKQYLGHMTWYLDLFHAMYPGGMKVAAPPQRWIVPGNWKSGAENVGGDNYHTPVVHKAIFDQGIYPVPLSSHMRGYHISAGNGHTLSLAVDPNDTNLTFWGLPDEITSMFRPTVGNGNGQLELARSCRNSMGTIWPNFSWIRVPIQHDPKKRPYATFHRLWLWRPLEPDKTEVWEWVLVWNGASAEFNRRSYDSAIASFGPPGIFEQDDSTPWRGIARSAGSRFFGKAGVQLNYQMGLESMAKAEIVNDFPGPGTVFATRWDEGYARHLYSRWLEFMMAE